MDIVFLLLIVYLAFRNSVIAKQKGRNRILWVIITILSYFFAEIIAICIVMFGFWGLTMEKIASYGNNTQAMVNDFGKFLMDKPIHWTFIMAFSLGGYLLVKYILEKMPDANKRNSMMK